MPEEKWFSHVQLFATPWTIARQAPLSMGFPRQEYWSGHFLLQSMPESVFLLGVTQSTRLNQLSRNKLGLCSTRFWLPPQISLLCNPARRSLCSVLLSRTGFPQERNSELPSSLALLSWDRHLRSLTWHPWWWRDDTWGGDTSDGEESACSAGDLSSVPGVGRSGGEHDNLPQYSCLENPMDIGAWWAIVQGVEKSWTWLSD